MIMFTGGGSGLGGGVPGLVSGGGGAWWRPPGTATANTVNILCTQFMSSIVYQFAAIVVKSMNLISAKIRFYKSEV